MTRSAASLLEELRAVDESSSIEAKTASQIDKSVIETVCAFSNEPGLGGGYLLLGVKRSPQLELFGHSYEVVGVDDPDKLQSDLATQCATRFNRPVRPQIRIELVDEKRVLVVFVPELAPTEKPVFVSSLGLPRGAFRRVGATDQEGTDDDLIVFYQGHQVDTYDSAVVSGADFTDLDPEAIRVYREMRRDANQVAEELTWTDIDFARALGAVVIEDGVARPTVAGVLLFGTTMALRRCFPMMRVDYVRVPGREWVSDPDRRFDTVEIRAPLLLAARRAIAAVRDDLPAAFNLPEGKTIRSDETILPARVLREAIVNALMHRSYRIHGPIQILRYSNRLEIRNPGHSLKAEEQLGEPGSQTRNPRIAAVMHEVHLAETKGSGIRAMRELMLQKDLLPPTFESTRRPDQFVATFLFHHFLGEADIAWLRLLTTERLSDEESRALVFVREVGAIDNAAYRSFNRTDTLDASTHLRRLRDLELLKMQGSGNKTYYVPGEQMRDTPAVSAVEQPKTESSAAVDPDLHELGSDLHKLGPDLHELGSDLHKLQPDLHKLQPDPHDPRSDLHKLEPAKLEIPQEIRGHIAAAGRRPRAPQVEALLLELCAWRALSARQLAAALGGRDPLQLTRKYLGPLVAARKLSYTIPQMPNHPDQKYVIPDSDEVIA